MANSMPVIKREGLDEADAAVVAQITKRDGTLYASRPKNADGDAQFVWRWVAFLVSPREQHSCMPVTDVFYLEKRWFRQDRAERPAHVKKLRAQAERIAEQVPLAQWHGLRRWARVL